jgi:hypothetical protein
MTENVIISQVKLTLKKRKFHSENRSHSEKENTTHREYYNIVKYSPQ